MSEGLQLSMNLLLIGMTTVFVILTLVVGGGKLLIAISNRYYKEEPSPVTGHGDDEDIPVAIISAVVQLVTDGEGKIDKIKKIDHG